MMALMRTARLALVLVLIVCLLKATKEIKRPTLDDFHVYETAATLVHQHRNDLIYNGADTGEDPQLRFADQNSAFALAAHSIGIPKVRLYVYPPLLADLLVPLTWMTAHLAGDLWTLLNILELCGVAAILMMWFHIRWNSLGAVALFVGIFSFLPVISCLLWGQVTIFLLLLWTFGIYSYRRGWTWLSAGAFALAAAIKLTPLIVLLPFVLWNEWRWVRSFILSLLILGALTCLFNGPSSISDYFGHVMPAMSTGIATFDNKSLLSSIAVSYTALTAGVVVPHGLMIAGKLLALLLVVTASLLSLPLRAAGSLEERATALALFAMLAVAVSPVSWKHAYAVCILSLCCLWVGALRNRTSTFFVILLTCCSLELSYFVLSLFVMKHTNNIAIGSWITPLLAIVTVLYALWLLGARANPRSQANRVSSLRANPVVG